MARMTKKQLIKAILAEKDPDEKFRMQVDWFNEYADDKKSLNAFREMVEIFFEEEMAEVAI